MHVIDKLIARPGAFNITYTILHALIIFQYSAIGPQFHAGSNFAAPVSPE